MFDAKMQNRESDRGQLGATKAPSREWFFFKFSGNLFMYQVSLVYFRSVASVQVRRFHCGTSSAYVARSESET